MLSGLRMQFTYLNVHKFRHGFNGTKNPMCLCRGEEETTEHFLLRCHCFSTQRIDIFNNLYNLDSSFSKLNTNTNSASNSNNLNKDITEQVIKFLKSTVRFSKQLLLDQ